MNPPSPIPVDACPPGRREDPALVALREEIKELCRARGVGAAVFLHSPHYSSFFVDPPPWGFVRFLADGQVQARLKTSEFPTPEDALACAEVTLSWLISLHQQLSGFGEQLLPLVRAVCANFEGMQHVNVLTPDNRGMEGGAGR